MLDQLFVLIEDLLTLKGREATQLKIEDRLRLNFGKRQSVDHFAKVFNERIFGFAASDSLPLLNLGKCCEVRRQPGPRFIHRTCISDQRNDVIERVDRLVEPF